MGERPAKLQGDSPAATPPETPARAPSPGAEEIRRRFLDGLYRAHWSDLVGWLRKRYGPGPPAPEDIAQTAFAKLAALDRYDNIQHPKALLYRAAANAAIDSVRWLRRTRAFVDDELNRKGEDLEEITPERVSLAREEFNQMATALDALTPKQKEVLIRNRFLGQTFQEISDATGWSTSDVFRQFKAALGAVRGAVDAGGDDGGR